MRGSHEPRAPPPDARAQVLEDLSSRGVETWLFPGPVIPEINDGEQDIAQVVEVARRTGSRLIYDKLNLRRWVLEAMGPLLELEFPELAERLPDLTGARSEYWRRTSSLIEGLCRRGEIPCEPAFPSAWGPE